MAFGSSITVTVNGVGKVLQRTGNGPGQSQFMLRETGMEWLLTIAHSKESGVMGDGYPMERHMIRFRKTIYAVPGTSPEKITESYFILRSQKSADLAADELVDHGLVDLVDSGTVAADLLAWMQ
jgi:hypothetical protein